MKIRKLHLKAFGPFSDQSISFCNPEFNPASNRESSRESSLDPGLEAPPGPGLCVVYGANEVGKTSALRAIRDLFYGIPTHSPDDFKHVYSKMRVGAEVEFSDGEVFSFLRRKGKKDTLLAYRPESGSGEERATRNTQLETLVSAIPAPLFENFYGLDHAELSRGSEALLEDDGELGKALFSAGLGAGNLRAVLDGLDEEADELFKPRGTTPRLNAVLSEVRALRNEVKDAALNPGDWKAAASRVQEVEERLRDLESEIERAHAERTRLARIGLTQPELGRLRHAQAAFEAISGTRELDADFEPRLRDALSLAQRARDRSARAVDTIALQSERLEGLDLSPSLIENRDTIESLAERIRAYQDAVDQLPRRKAELEKLEGALDSILKTLASDGSPGALAQLRASLERRPRIRELASEFVAAKTRLAQAIEDRKRAEQVLTTRQRKLPAHSVPGDSGAQRWSDSAALRRALERAQRLGDIDDRIATLSSAFDASEEECARALDRLGLWSGRLGDIDRLAFPESETLDEYQARFDAIARRVDLLTAERARSNAEEREAREQLTRLRREGKLPSEDERDARRDARDASWQLIRRHFIDPGVSDGLESSGSPKDPSALDRRLPNRFESEVAAADEIADRLRNEAKRVAQESQLLARLENITSNVEDQHKAAASLEAEREQTQRDWVGVWKAVRVSPNTPMEMRGWLSRLHALRDRAVAARADQKRLEGLCADRDLASLDLDEAMRSANPSPAGSGEAAVVPGDRFRLELDWRVAAAEALASELETARRTLTRLHEDIEQASEDLEQAERAKRSCEAGIAAWQLDWVEAIAGLGLRETARPLDAENRLEILDQLFERIREREQLLERVAAMEAEVARFETEVGEVVPRCAAGLPSASADQSVVALRTLLSGALEQETTRSEIAGALGAAREERAESERSRTQASDVLAALRIEAGVDANQDLETAVVRSRAFASARRALDEAESRVEEQGGGRSVTELETEAKDVDPDRIPARIERLDLEIEESTRARDVVLQERVRCRDALARMDGSARAARLAEEVQEKTAAVDGLLRRYVTVTLAREILGREIERYRERHQTPVLDRAGELFAALTRGAYARMQSEFDDGDRRQLVAVDSGGEKKGMAALSSGTRDQLFLALRLATLEETLGGAESMPLIADDILVEFDEDRSRAALEVLADLGQKTQILLFSHHAHIAEQARELGNRVCVVEL